MHGDPTGFGDLSNSQNRRQRINRASPAIVRVLQADEGRGRIMVIGGPDRGLDLFRFKDPPDAWYPAGLNARQPCRGATLVSDHVRSGLHDHLIAGVCVQAYCKLVRHRAGRHEQGRFLSQQARRHVLQSIHGGIFTEDVIADFGSRYRLAHPGRGLGDRIAAEINHAATVFQKNTTVIRCDPSS